MRIQFVLTILLTSSVLAQTTGNTVLSEPFVLKPRHDFAVPLIRLEDPALVNDTVIVTARVLLLKGAATAANGIKRVDVNGMSTIPSATGGFRMQLPLHPSSNPITVKAEDNAGNVGELSFTALCDLRPPSIDVIQPQIRDVRGIHNVVVETGVLIARVYDDCMPLKDITVNGSEVEVGPDSLITVQLASGGGNDTLRIVAVNMADRSTEVIVPIVHTPFRAQPSFLSGRTYALVVGIDAYRGIWPKLKNAVNDARSVARILSSEYQFSTVDTLFDNRATRDNVIGKIESLGRTLRPEDNLLIYFSGHGLKEPPYNKGYWVPVDATDRSIGRYISNRDIQDYLAGMNPRHVLLITDACFAADIFKGATLRYDFEDNDNYYKRVGGLKSRKALTSGGDEPVMDGGSPGHSIFASYLINALEGIKKPYFSAWEVYSRLRIGVVNNSDQLPQFDAIKNCGDEGGEFLFVRR